MAIIGENQSDYLFLAVIGTLLAVIILPYDASAQTLGTTVGEKNMFGLNIPFIRVGHSPQAIAVNPDTNKVYVANSESNTVSVIDISSMRVKNIPVRRAKIKDIPVGAYPQTVVIGLEKKVYVASFDSLDLIDGNTNTLLKRLNFSESEPYVPGPRWRPIMVPFQY